MVIAVVAMDMVQVPVDQIVHMVAVGDGFVPTARPMHVIGVMASALVCRRASIRVGFRHRDDMLVDVVAVGVVQVPVMEVVNVPFMLDGLVTTARAVNMIV